MLEACYCRTIRLVVEAGATQAREAGEQGVQMRDECRACVLVCVCVCL